MSTYIIHAYDEIYGGLHGIEDWDLVESDSELEVIRIAESMSADVIDSYTDITDELAARAHELTSEDLEYENSNNEEEEDLFNYYYDSCVDEDIDYEIIRLNPIFSFDQYRDKIRNNIYTYEELAEKFGMEEF